MARASGCSPISACRGGGRSSASRACAWGTICSFKIVNPPLSMSDAQKSELRRANDNPWYCLATLNGEQQEWAHIDLPNVWDEDLAGKNRVSWNRWMAGGTKRQDFRATRYFSQRHSLGPPTSARSRLREPDVVATFMKAWGGPNRFLLTRRY